MHNLYRRSANLLNEKHELISLVLRELGPGPFALVVHPDEPDFLASGGFAAQLRVEDPVRLDESSLSLGNLQITLGNLPQWNPSPSWEQVDRDDVQRALAILPDLLDEHAPEGSLAPLAGSPTTEVGADIAHAVVQAASDPADELREGLRSRDESLLAITAGKLAGLGGGVTPSGDDFLMGALHALWMLLDREEARRLASVIVESAATRTNAISRAWLEAAGRGEAGNEWHVLVFELIGGGPLAEAAAWLIQRGHTSGADAMAGYLVAARVLIN
jgi:hypothetical protein